jgi:transcription elongation factor GreA-like protein
MKEGSKEKFLKIYANLPLGIRKEIIVVLENEPFTWSAVYVEVFNNTEKSIVLLKKLEEMKII